MGRVRDRMASDLKLKGYSAATCKAYLRCARNFVAYCGKSPHVLGEADVRRYLHHRIDDCKVGAAAVKMDLAAIKFLFAQTLRRPEVVESIPWPKVPKPIPEILSPDELVRLFDHARTESMRTALETMYAAGLRVSEVCRLQVRDLDSARGVVHVRLGKGNKDRLTLLSPSLLDNLRAYWRRFRPDSWLFPGRGGTRPIGQRAVQDGFSKAVRRAKIARAVRPHSLRHSFATHMLEAGVDIRVIQALLGHKSLATTSRYTQVRVDYIAQLPDPLALLTQGADPVE